MQEFVESLRVLARWRELFELLGPHENSRLTVEQLEEAQSRAAEFATRGAFLQKYDGGAYHLWQSQLRAHHDIARRASLTAIRRLTPFLTRGWYLSNTLGDAYPFSDTSATQCPYCQRPATRWIGRNPLHGERRQLDICARCGTVRDLPELGCIADVEIDMPGELHAGADTVGVVRISLKDGGLRPRLIQVATRLDTPGLPGVSPWKETQYCEQGGMVEEAPFKISIPAEISPRQCDLRVLVASDDAIAFAHRVVILRPRVERGGAQLPSAPRMTTLSTRSRAQWPNGVE